MHDDEVGNTVSFAGLYQCRDLMISSVHSLGPREHQLYLLESHTRWDSCIIVNSIFNGHGLHCFFFKKYIKPEPQFVINSWGSALYSITVCICAAKREQKLQKTEEFTTDHKPQEKLRTTARHAICGQIRKSSAEEVCACQGAVTKCKKSHICTDHKLTKATSTPDEFKNCVFV